MKPILCLSLFFVAVNSFPFHFSKRGESILYELKGIKESLERVHFIHLKKDPTRRYLVPRLKRDVSNEIEDSPNKLDYLINEVLYDNKIGNAYEKLNDKAEDIRFRLNDKINRLEFTLTHLKDIAKHFEVIHDLSKQLVESKATAGFVKNFAIQQLKQSVDKMNRCDVCWKL